MPVTLATFAIWGAVNAKLPVPQPTSRTRSPSERPPNAIRRAGCSVYMMIPTECHLNKKATGGREEGHLLGSYFDGRTSYPRPCDDGFPLHPNGHESAIRFRQTGRDDAGNLLYRKIADYPAPRQHCLAETEIGTPVLFGASHFGRPHGVYWTPNPVISSRRALRALQASGHRSGNCASSAGLGAGLGYRRHVHLRCRGRVRRH